MNKSAKSKVIAKFGGSETNTGSTEVQIALLSGRISELTDHMKLHPKDLHSEKGLRSLVAKRRKLLNYLSRKNYEGYKVILAELNLRK